MFLRTFDLEPFLQQVCGTEPFRRYCRERGIAFPQRLGPAPSPEMGAIWRASLAERSPHERERAELELCSVHELATPAGVALLTEAAEGSASLPDHLPGLAAQALWFFVHRPSLFAAVSVHAGLLETAVWQRAQAPPGIHVDEPDAKAAVLAGSLSAYFRATEGTGRFCVARATRVCGADCFTAHVADRPQVLDTFTARGAYRAAHVRPAFAIHFAYHAADGALFVRAGQRPRGKVLALLRHFGEAVLGVRLDDRCLREAYDLDRLKALPDLPLDGPDMEMARVKALELVYPAHEGRRRVRLDTRPSDRPQALGALVQNHLGPAALRRLRVSYAELQVRLNAQGTRRTYLIRLWPDRCSLGQTALGGRLRACLKRWGLDRAP